MGLVLLLPESAAAPVGSHLTHLLQRLLKVCCAVPPAEAPECTGLVQALHADNRGAQVPQWWLYAAGGRWQHSCRSS